jgi:hypothetical protein
VRHAGAASLASIEPLLATLRTLPGLTERKPGIFYRGSVAFLHFHEDPAGLFADLKQDGAFVRRRVVTTAERRDLIAAARATLEKAQSR